MSEERTETSPPEAQTSDSAHDKGGSLWILWGFMALLIAYPLSIGPVARFYKASSSRRPPSFVIAIYTPILALCDRSEVAGHTLVWYLGLWGAI